MKTETNFRMFFLHLNACFISFPFVCSAQNLFPARLIKIIISDLTRIHEGEDNILEILAKHTFITHV